MKMLACRERNVATVGLTWYHPGVSFLDWMPASTWPLNGFLARHLKCFCLGLLGSPTPKLPQKVVETRFCNLDSSMEADWHG